MLTVWISGVPGQLVAPGETFCFTVTPARQEPKEKRIATKEQERAGKKQTRFRQENGGKKIKRLMAEKR